jgi:hypothetical protein
MGNETGSGLSAFMRGEAGSGGNGGGATSGGGKDLHSKDIANVGVDSIEKAMQMFGKEFLGVNIAGPEDGAGKGLSLTNAALFKADGMIPSLALQFQANGGALWNKGAAAFVDKQGVQSSNAIHEGQAADGGDAATHRNEAADGGNPAVHVNERETGQLSSPRFDFGSGGGGGLER